MKFIVVFAAFIVAINALADHSMWMEFKDKHSKEYKLIEDKLRFQVFQNNVRKIEEHNAKYEKGEVSYFLKVTKFADWTNEEFKAMLNRQLVNKPKLEHSLGTHEADLTDDIPSSVDWRKQNATLEVKDQGQCGSCWAFSATGALEAQLILKKNQRISLSEQELVDCATNDGDLGCGGGYPLSSFKYVKSHGIRSEEDYPYNAQDNSCKKEGTKVIDTIAGYKEVAPNEESLISAIATAGPVSVLVDANTWSFYGGGVLDDCGQDIDHAVLAVGYEPDHFILKNSWGADWGEQGYIRIARGKNLCAINDENTYPVL